jgi:hypothetical protein
MTHAVFAPIVIAQRFCGPPRSANGGYLCGRLAALAEGIVTVRLRVPPPLDVPMQPTRSDDGRLFLHAGDVLVAEAEPAELSLDVPPAVSHETAQLASHGYIGFESHPFGTCFVCGVQRSHGDGMRIFAGATATAGQVAAPWVPDASLCLPDGKVAPEFMWAALDCPGFFAASDDGRAMLLAEFTAQVDRRACLNERCVVIGWRMLSAGRKHEVGTALFDERGTLLARARGLWIEPRAVSGAGKAESSPHPLR